MNERKGGSKLFLYEGDVQSIYGIYSIPVLNVAWWTDNGWRQRIANNIDVLTCVCVHLCVFSSLLFKFSVHTLNVCVDHRERHGAKILCFPLLMSSLILRTAMETKVKTILW